MVCVGHPEPNKTLSFNSFLLIAAIFFHYVFPLAARDSKKVPGAFPDGGGETKVRRQPEHYSRQGRVKSKLPGL